ncbi:MAG: hypothetical protein AAF604_17015 [Acidobacteriota bacterium]
MDRDQIRELLPWYLNGSLEEKERTAVAEALAADPELRRDLVETWRVGKTFGERVPTAELVAHVFGDATSLDGELIERLADPEEIALLKESLARLSDAPEVVPFPAAQPARRSWLPAAMAAGLMTLVASGGWFNEWQNGLRLADDKQAVEQQLAAVEQQKEDALDRLAASAGGDLTTAANIAVTFLADGVQRGEPAIANQLALRPGSELHLFELNAPEDQADYGELQLRLLDGDGNEKVRVNGLEVQGNGRITALVDRELLTPGLLRGELRGRTGDGEWQLLRSYALEITP